jgi:hypothetical protein
MVMLGFGGAGPSLGPKISRARREDGPGGSNASEAVSSKGELRISTVT